MAKPGKRALVEVLLAHYEDFFSTLGAGAGTGGGDGLGFLPGMSRHPSVLELVRCLELLYVHDPRLYRHVKAFYTAETRTADVQVRRRSQRGYVTVTERQRQALVPGWVDRGKVAAGVTFLAGEFRGSVYLPDELQHVA